tara:strand:- start:901 stop:2268 length:1368 start_codon:yes stop_codon:yes gene_type:complete
MTFTNIIIYSGISKKYWFHSLKHQQEYFFKSLETQKFIIFRKKPNYTKTMIKSFDFVNYNISKSVFNVEKQSNLTLDYIRKNEYKLDLNKTNETYKVIKSVNINGTEIHGNSSSKKNKTNFNEKILNNSNSLLYRINTTNKTYKVINLVNLNETEIHYNSSSKKNKDYEINIQDIVENVDKNISAVKKEKIIVIIVIERNRTLEFDILHSLIKNKINCGSSYKIVHVEQSKNCLFNRGLLANVGFVKAYETWKDIERIVIHDTDMFPESTMCYNKPYHAPVIHYATRVSQFGYKLPYKSYFGGVIGFIPSVYKIINGFSNSFWGWGGEDDDIYNRVVNTGFNIVSSASGRFLSICHERDTSNIKNNVKILNDGSRTNDGLSNLDDVVNSIVTKINDDEVHVVVNVDLEKCKTAPSTPPPFFLYNFSGMNTKPISYNTKIYEKNMSNFIWGVSSIF